MQGQDPMTVAVLLLCALLALVVVWQVGRIALGVLRSLLDREGRAAAAAYATAIGAYERDLAVLPIEQARAAAERVLADSQYLSRITADDQVPPGLVKELGPELRRLLQRFRRIGTAAGQSLDWEAVEPYEFGPELIKVGDQDEHAHLCVLPGDERLTVVEEDSPRAEFAESFPSVFHWILWAERSEQLLRGGPAGASGRRSPP